MYLTGADGNFDNKERGHLPIPMSALRLRRSDGLPGDGGYAKSFIGCFSFEGYVPSPKFGEDVVMTKVLQAIQVADKVGPPLPPNVFQGCDTSKKTLEDLRLMYRELLHSSGSRKINGRHFVEGAQYQNLGDDPRFSACKIIDPRVDGNIDIQVGVHETYTKLKRKTPSNSSDDEPHGDGHFGIDGDSFEKYDATRMQEETLVQIRDTLCPENEAALNVLNTNAFEAASKEVNVSGPKGSCRSDSGDYGLMVPLGSSLVDRLSPVPWTYAATGRATNLQQTAAAATGIAHCYFPGHLNALQRTEKEVGIPESSFFLQDSVIHEQLFPNKTGGAHPTQRSPTCIICSCNLQNSSHYDPGDAMIGIGLWTCCHGENGVTNWYFILPNLIGFNEDGSVFQGVAIRLHHGIAIAWDGRVLRHCTALTGGVRDPVGANVGVTGHVFSTYLGTKVALVERFRQRNYELARELKVKQDAVELEKKKVPGSGKKKSKSRGRKRPRKK